MNKNKAPKTSLKSLIRKALKNRYDYDHVTIDNDGNIKCKYDRYDSVITHGNVATYNWVRTDSMNIQLRNNETVIYTFAYDN